MLKFTDPWTITVTYRMRSHRSPLLYILQCLQKAAGGLL